LFFGAEPELEKHLAAIEQAAHDSVRVVILVLKRARNPDAAFLNLLSDFHMNLERRNIVLLLSGVHPVLRKALTGIGLDARIGVDRIFCQRATQLSSQGSSTGDAIQFAYNLLGDELCSTCPRRQEPTSTMEALDYEI